MFKRTFHLEFDAVCHVHYYAHAEQALETNTRKIVARLERENWSNIGGGNHDKFTNPAREGVLIIVPRHKAVSPGVARDIAKKAGWVS